MTEFSDKTYCHTIFQTYSFLASFLSFSAQLGRVLHWPVKGTTTGITPKSNATLSKILFSQEQI